MLRILSNVARFCSTFAIGLIYVRAIQTFGDETFAVIIVSAACIALFDCVREVVRTFTVPALGAAYHASDKAQFGAVLVNCLFISTAFGIVSFAASIWIAVHPEHLGIPKDYLAQATTYLLLRFLAASVSIAVCPLASLFAVYSDFARYNAIFVAERFLDLFAALLVLAIGFAFKTSCPLIAFGWFISGALLALNASIAWLAYRRLPDRHLSLRLLTIQGVKTLMSGMGWSTAYILGLTLHIRFDILLANALFGLKTGVAYSIAVQLSGYVRTGVMALGNGLDSVAARAWVNQDQAELRRQTRINSSSQVLATLGATGVLFLSLPDLLPIWLGGRNSSDILDFAAVSSISRLLLIGMAARSASEGLMAILSGCGQIRSHALPILLGSFVNPILITILYTVLPDEHRFLAPALSFSIIMPFVHLLLVPWIFANAISITPGDLVRYTAVPIAAFVLAYGVAIVSASAAPTLSGFPQLPCLFVVLLTLFICCLHPSLLGLRTKALVLAAMSRFNT